MEKGYSIMMKDRVLHLRDKFVAWLLE